MKYIDIIGDFLQAYQDVLDNGGQLYPGNGKESATVVVRGNYCYTYWLPDSKRHQQVKELCSFFNLEPYGKTGGRIARWLIDDVIKVPYKNTYWSRKYRLLARQGYHWHYHYVDAGKSFLGVELDLKSAYISSLFAGQSFLFHPSKGYLDDTGSLAFLKELTPDLPKWFRLQLLGCLSTHRITFYAKDKANPNNKELVLKSYCNIPYGSAFNAVHRAIFRNYKIMEKIHKMGGKYIRRMHTDSFMLDMECPVQLQQDIQDYVESKGLVLDAKRCGQSYFFDLNTGFCGKSFVGSKVDCLDLMRSQGVKMKRTNYPEGLLDRFGELLNGTSMDPKNEVCSPVDQPFESIQLSLL